MKESAAAAVAVFLLLANFPLATSTSQTIRFYGTFNGQDLGTGEGLVEQAGVGNFTDMGSSTFISIGTFSQPKDPTCVDTATFERTFTAFSGDKTRFVVTGQTCPTGEPEFYLFNGTYTVEGGTGRYLGATGSGIIQTIVNTVASFFYGFMKGTLTLQTGGTSSEEPRAGELQAIVVGLVASIAAVAIGVVLISRRTGHRNRRTE